ncbi:hypothetical protein [Rhodoferax aquaticus]|uniref:Uncharacterized protein n=1 Tax=Rhodoferax aquaticus TaxID=2527691 RepID=A0A515EK70_9BURK|nr:hypothetical protein [Rhodoferax aquaticus]QDL52989.1 hypothetical protein EXZ61_01720 [Rhodoferax aquaticus]
MSKLPLALRVCAAMALLLCAATASAQQAPPNGPKPAGGQEQQEGPEHRKPPAEALAACKSLAAGAACNFTSPRGAEAGTCGAPEGKPLACRPAHTKGQGPGMGKEKPKS